MLWSDLRDSIPYPELIEMNIYDAYIEWIHYFNKGLHDSYLQELDLYLKQLALYTMSSEPPNIKPPSKPNYYILDVDKYKLCQQSNPHM